MKRTEEKQGDSLGVATWPQRADSGGAGEGRELFFVPKIFCFSPGLSTTLNQFPL